MLHGYHHDETKRSRRSSYMGETLHAKSSTDINISKIYLARPFVCLFRLITPSGEKVCGPSPARSLILGCVAGVRAGWSPLSPATWKTWLKLRRWQRSGGFGIPWILNLGDHREVAANPVTPLSTLKSNKKIFDTALSLDGVFCAATHYWEMDSPSLNSSGPKVGDHLRFLAELARSNPHVVWRKVGDVVSNSESIH